MVYRWGNIYNISEEEEQFWICNMTDYRKNQLCKMRFRDDRLRSICGEKLVKEMISDNLGLHIEDIKLSHRPSGKPVALGIKLNFNVSHSGEVVLCAISSNGIGVDVEKIEDIDLGVVDIVCSPKEKEYIYYTRSSGMGKHDVQLHNFYEIWTAKEAWAKCKEIPIDDFIYIDFFEIRKFGTRISIPNYTAFIIEE